MQHDLRVEVGKRYSVRNAGRYPEGVIVVRVYDPGPQTFKVQVIMGGVMTSAWWTVDATGTQCGTIRAPDYDLMGLWPEPTSAQPRKGYQAPVKTCPSVYRVIPRGEWRGAPAAIQTEAWEQVGGKTTSKVTRHAYSSHLLLQIDGNIVEVPEELVERQAQHTWHDNGGMLRTWCAHCNADGEWDRSTFKYVEKVLDGKTVLSKTEDVA